MPGANFLTQTKKAILCGWQTSLEDIRMFTDAIPKINTEYLITVNIAKCLAKEIQSSDGDPYQIHLEHSSRRFVKDSFPLYKIISSGRRLGKGSKIVGRRVVNNIDRNGRIDIAIYSSIAGELVVSEQFSPICAIEIKGFNPQKNLVLADLKRNMEYFKITASSGSSSIKYSIVAGLYAKRHSRQTVLDDAICVEELMALEKKVKNYTKQISKAQNVDISVECQSISINRHGEVYLEGNTLAVDLATKHHFMGFTVCFTTSGHDDACKSQDLL